MDRGQQFLGDIPWKDYLATGETQRERDQRIYDTARAAHPAPKLVRADRKSLQDLLDEPEPLEAHITARNAAARLAERGSYPIQGLNAARTFYSPEQAQEEARGLAKFQHVADRRPLPANLRFEHTSEMDYATGQPIHSLKLYDDNAPNGTRESMFNHVGEVKWEGDTGHVKWLGVDSPYRGHTANLMTAAHQIAQQTGGTGPSKSPDLSEYSYRLMRHYAPSLIHPDTSVGGVPREDWDNGVRDDEHDDWEEDNWDHEGEHEDYVSSHRYFQGMQPLWERAYSLITSHNIPREALFHSSSPGSAPSSAAAHITAARHAHEDGDYESAETHLINAANNLGAVGGALGSQHPMHRQVMNLHNDVWAHVTDNR